MGVGDSPEWTTTYRFSVRGANESDLNLARASSTLTEEAVQLRLWQQSEALRKWKARLERISWLFVKGRNIAFARKLVSNWRQGGGCYSNGVGCGDVDGYGSGSKWRLGFGVGYGDGSSCGGGYGCGSFNGSGGGCGDGVGYAYNAGYGCGDGSSTSASSDIELLTSRGWLGPLQLAEILE